jgi:dienelactone hydrolase
VAATLDRLAARDFEGARAYFDATMTEKLPASALGQVWSGLTAQLGPLTSRTLRAERQEMGYAVRTYDCAFEKGHFGARFAFDGEQKIAGLFFVPLEALHDEATREERPKDDRFVTRDVAVGPVGHELPGTLTLPKGASKVPAVVLVHGSGPHDRDEKLGPNRPFADLAEGLTLRGVAVLRYDKRSLVHPEEIATKPGVTVKEEVLDDAHAAVALLRAQPEVDPRRVFVVGHSLGGTLAPRIAREDPKVAGLVLLAAAARPIGEVVIDQTDYLERVQPDLTSDAKARLESIRESAKRTLDPTLTASTPGSFLAAPASYWVDLRGYDPVATARALDLPILVVQAGRDYQAPPKELALWKSGLAGRPRVRFDEHPALNHLLIPGEGPSTPAEYVKPGHVEPALIDAVATFVKTSA